MIIMAHIIIVYQPKKEMHTVQLVDFPERSVF